jgi:AAA family ATP:ADP antiporter
VPVLEKTEGQGLRERFLRLFADVRPGETGVALLMLANLFLLLVGYYILKTVREPLVLATGGAEMKSYAAAGQAVVLMGFIPLYGWLARRVDRLRLIVTLMLFFVLNIELFNRAGRAKLPYVGVVFYIWVGIFSLAAIAQFWSFANDIYRQEVGNRLFPMIAIGATAGSPVGAEIAERLFKAGMDPYTMLHISAAILLVHLGIYWVVSRQQALHADFPAQESTKLLGPGGFHLVFASPYLRLAALLFVLLNIVNTNGEYIIGRLTVAAAKEAAAANPAVSIDGFIGSFYGGYFFWVNVLAFAIQSLLVSRIAKYFGFAGVMLSLPIVAFGTYGLMAAGVGFAMTRWAKTAENSADYSVMNTGRQMLWLPTTRDEKYKGKQTIDTFFVRAGDVVSAGVVYAGTTWLRFDVPGFARTNLILVLAWIGVVVLLVRENRVLAGRNQERT